MQTYATASKEPDQILAGSTAGVEKIPLDAKPVPVFFYWPDGVHSSDARAALRRWAGNPEVETNTKHRAECKAFFYVPLSDGTVDATTCKHAKAFFGHFGSEALVYEWDGIEGRFTARKPEYFLNPSRVSLV